MILSVSEFIKGEEHEISAPPDSKLKEHSDGISSYFEHRQNYR